MHPMHQNHWEEFKTLPAIDKIYQGLWEGGLGIIFYETLPRDSKMQQGWRPLGFSFRRNDAAALSGFGQYGNSDQLGNNLKSDGGGRGGEGEKTS